MRGGEVGPGAQGQLQRQGFTREHCTLFDRCYAVAGAPLQHVAIGNGRLAVGGQQTQFNAAAVEHGVADFDGITAVLGKLQALRVCGQGAVEQAEVFSLWAIDDHAQAPFAEQALRRAVVLSQAAHHAEIHQRFADVELAFLQGLGSAGYADQQPQAQLTHIRCDGHGGHPQGRLQRAGAVSKYTAGSAFSGSS